MSVIRVCKITALFSQRFTQAHGPLILTEEEKRTLVAEGYPVPTKLPLSKAEEKSLKKVKKYFLLVHDYIFLLIKIHLFHFSPFSRVRIRKGLLPRGPCKSRPLKKGL